MKKLTRRAVCAGIAAVPAALILHKTEAAQLVVETPAPVIEPDALQRDIIERIVAVVAHQDGVTGEVMRSAERTWLAVNARRKAMYLSFLMSGKSLAYIGYRFGNRDHTTVLHAVRVLDARACTDMAFEAEMEYLATQAGLDYDALVAVNAKRLRNVRGRAYTAGLENILLSPRVTA